MKSLGRDVSAAVDDVGPERGLVGAQQEIRNVRCGRGFGGVGNVSWNGCATIRSTAPSKSARQKTRQLMQRLINHMAALSCRPIRARIVLLTSIPDKRSSRRRSRAGQQAAYPKKAQMLTRPPPAGTTQPRIPAQHRSLTSWHGSRNHTRLPHDPACTKHTVRIPLWQRMCRNRSRCRLHSCGWRRALFLLGLHNVWRSRRGRRTEPSARASRSTTPGRLVDSGAQLVWANPRVAAMDPGGVVDRESYGAGANSIGHVA